MNTDTPAARIFRTHDGIQVAECFMQYGKPLVLTQAIARAQDGKTVFVRREDVGAVLAAITGENGR